MTAIDIGTMRGLGSIVVMIAFISLVIWTCNSKRKKSFEEATMLPFADDPEVQKHIGHASRSDKE